ncbi:hypothetical protein FUA25_05175 [Chryseobacterium sp.]|nr:hypothetical protein FUA25_05175 [Chryseobacterium sp.]
MLGSMLCFSQNVGVSIETEQSIEALNEEMFSLLLKIQNNTDAEQHLQLVCESDKGVRILNNDISLTLSAGEKMFFPLKIFIDKKQPSGISTITSTLIAKNKSAIATAETALEIKLKRNLRIIANEPQVLIHQVGDSLRISTQVYNSGNQTEEVDLTATFPQNFGSEIAIKKKTTLEPFTEKEVVFSQIIDKNLLRMELFVVNIAGRNSNKEFFGNAVVIVQNALGSRRYIDPLNLNQYLQRSTANHISITANNPFSKFGASENLDLRSEFNLGSIKATLNLNGGYFQNLDTKLLMQNTWLKVEHRNLGIQLGNISTSELDLNLIGRGAEVFYGAPEVGKLGIKMGVLEKNYNLLDPLPLHNSPRGYAAYAQSSYSFDEKRILESAAVIDNDPFQKSLIIKNSYQYNKENNTVYSVDLGYGYAQSPTIPENAKPSVALGLTYYKKWNRYIFSSNNFYSSGYYPGIKKGSTVFEQRISREFDKFSLFGNYNLNVYEPKNIDPLYDFNTLSKRMKIEFGGNFSLSRRAKMSVTTQGMDEQSDIFLGPNFVKTTISYRAALLNSALNYNAINNKNRISLLYSQGFSYYPGFSDLKYIYRLQANWYHSDLMLSTNYQEGNFMLYEGNVNNEIRADSRKISAIASYRFNMLQDKLSIVLSTLGNYDNQFGTSISFNSSLDYHALRATRLFANINYNKFIKADVTSATTYYQIGINQDLPTFGEENVNYKNGQMKIFVFYDLNNNNVYDVDNDRPASNVKIKINNTIFVSDADGSVRYRKLPYADYTVKSMEEKWFTEDQLVKVDRKEVFLTVPFQKTSTIKGKIAYQKTSKTQYEIPEILAGMPIIFKNQFGRIFTFYTDAKGEYTAYVPLGDYEVSIDAKVLQKNVYVDENLQNVKAEEGTVKTLQNFLLKVREKKVEVKKFGISN